jgi:hypothetical protein
MRSVSRIIAAGTTCALAVSLAACSSSSNHPGASDNSGGSGGSTATAPVDGGGAGSAGPTFPKDALSTFMTPDGSMSIELRTSPDQPIHVGPNNQGELRIRDLEGNAVDGLSIKITTWMPVMRHACSAAPVKVKPQGDGVYLLDPLVASMPGKCELQLTINVPSPDGGAGSMVSVTSPTFDIPQPS